MKNLPRFSPCSLTLTPMSGCTFCPDTMEHTFSRTADGDERAEEAGLNAKRLVWMGGPTRHFAETVAFFRDILGLEAEREARTSPSCA